MKASRGNGKKMSTSSVLDAASTAATEKVAELKIQRSVFDLATMDRVTLVKMFTPPVAASFDEALSFVSGDEARLLEVVNKGLAADARLAHNTNQEGWFKTDDEGDISEPYTGTFGDQADVQTLIRTIAITACGYDPKGSTAEKKAAREEAIGIIKDNPKLIAKLVASANRKSEAEG